MLFHSFAFLVFFPAVVAVYYALPHRSRWALLLAASYFFYAWWRVEYLALIVFSTLVDYAAGLGMGRAQSQRLKRLWLAASLTANLGLLGAFKYFNFLNANVEAVVTWLGLPYGVPMLDVLLPVGISFYTFQSISYTVDVYRGKRPPERHLGIFAVYVSFFPQLVAGPIERSTTLLPQFRREHPFSFDNFIQGFRLMLWGYFIKVAVADRLGIYVDQVYGNVDQYEGVTMLIATYFFAFQILGDFAGYSYIAIGAAKIMGYSLMENFRRPYFADSVQQFWREWHISLGAWFRDYLYIPIGGSKSGTLRTYRNLMLVFFVSGVWHGAAWTVILFGVMQGLFVLGEKVFRPWTARFSAATGLDRIPWLHTLVRVTVTFHLVLVTWVLFRAASMADALTIFRKSITGLFTTDHLFVPTGDVTAFLINWCLIAFVMAVQYVQGDREVGMFLNAMRRAPRWVFYFALLFGILAFGEFGERAFIYFQF